jgi:hypothetical protein
MFVNYKYSGQSAIVNGLHDSYLAFATNTLREAAFFKGEIRDPRILREGLAALYAVVISDYKYHPKDRLEFQAWLEAQDQLFLQSLSVKSKKAKVRIEELEARKAHLDKKRHERRRPFYDARRSYFEYVYENQYELDYLLDPVITVHPDEIFFEAFSKDESSYARLGVPYTQFKTVDEFECGTTNIDFSARLHNELDRMRTYRRTRLDIDPSGFTVKSEGSAAHKEKKIDLPDSWVKGFLQVHSVMSMSLTHFRCAPIDLYNICRFLKRKKARASPRALRYELTPGKRVRAVLEPWNYEIELTAIYTGPKQQSIRTWGRTRLEVLERLLPVARSVDVYLAGFGLPSIYCVDLGGPSFTLALSGWTDNDWTGDGARFSLLTRRVSAEAKDLLTVYDIMQRRRRSSEAAVAAEAGIGKEKARSVLSYLCQIGRAIYDLNAEVFRHRDLFMLPFTEKEARRALKSPEEDTPQAKKARLIFENDNVRLIARRPVKTGFKLSGSAKGSDNKRVRPMLHVDKEGAIIEAKCTCNDYKKHKLTKGPCEHILALRLAHMSRLEAEKGD